MKKVLITGKNSYVGSSFKNWLMKEQGKYEVDTIDLRDRSWINTDFGQYDVVFHVAGIAHLSSNPKMKDLYNKVNRDLTIETAMKSKSEGVRQFIFMSSIIVYGEGSRNKKAIDKFTVPAPSNFYGESKLQAEEGIKNLETNNFRVVILRPPMIYGKGAKGNYPKLAKIAKLTPVFPEIDNQRSMLHLDNLCEFVKLMIDNNETGLHFPQNTEYVQTSELVKLIAEVNGKKIRMTKLFNPILKWMFGKVKLVDKVFGNLIYEKSMSYYGKANYQIRNFRESIELSELEKEK